MSAFNLDSIVFNIIRERRNSAQKIADDNLRKVRENKRFDNLYIEYQDILQDKAKKEYLKDFDKVNLLNDKLIRVSMEIRKMLTDMGYEKNALKPNYFCEMCYDTGYFKGNKCQCFKNEMNRQLMIRSGINKSDLPSFSDVKFDAYDGSYIKEVQNLFSIMNAYTNDLHTTTKKNVTISGNTGVGKTFLVECMVNNAIEHGYYTYYVTAIALGQQMLKFHLADVNNKHDVLKNVLECDLLVIDDLGTEPILNNITEEYFYYIISERIRLGLNTVITTNLSLDQIRDVYGERVFSRLASKSNSLLFNFKGKDLRVNI